MPPTAQPALTLLVSGTRYATSAPTRVPRSAGGWWPAPWLTQTGRVRLAAGRHDPPLPLAWLGVRAEEWPQPAFTASCAGRL